MLLCGAGGGIESPLGSSGRRECPARVAFVDPISADAAMRGGVNGAPGRRKAEGRLAG